MPMPKEAGTLGMPWEQSVRVRSSREGRRHHQGIRADVLQGPGSAFLGQPPHGHASGSSQRRPAGFPTELTLAAPVMLASPIDERRGGQQRGYAVNRSDDGEAVQQGARMTT